MWRSKQLNNGAKQTKPDPEVVNCVNHVNAEQTVVCLVNREQTVLHYKDDGNTNSTSVWVLKDFNRTQQKHSVLRRQQYCSAFKLRSAWMSDVGFANNSCVTPVEERLDDFTTHSRTGSPKRDQMDSFKMVRVQSLGLSRPLTLEAALYNWLGTH